MAVSSEWGVLGIRTRMGGLVRYKLNEQETIFMACVRYQGKESLALMGIVIEVFCRLGGVRRRRRVVDGRGA